MKDLLVKSYAAAVQVPPETGRISDLQMQQVPLSAGKHPYRSGLRL